MTLFFNLETLTKKAQSDQFLVRALENAFNRKNIPKHPLSDHPYIPKVLEGTSFLLKPKELFNSRYDYTFKAQYIKVAGCRSYYDYTMYGVTTLNIRLFPDLNIELLKNNPLIKINNNSKTITFKLEE